MDDDEYQQIPRNRVLLENLTVDQVIQKIPCTIWNLRVHYHVHKSLLFVCAKSDESSPQPPNVSALILSLLLNLGLPGTLHKRVT